MSYLWMVKVKRTSLLVTIFILCVALLASCAGSTDEGSEGSNIEEVSNSDSKDRGSNEQEASSSDSEDQSRENPDEGGGEGFNDEGESPNYPDNTPQQKAAPAPPPPPYPVNPPALKPVPPPPLNPVPPQQPKDMADPLKVDGDGVEP